MRSTRRWWAILGIPSLAVASLVLCMPVLLSPGRTEPAGTGTVDGIPERVLRSYQAADGWCPGLRWQLLAGVGSVESGHATSGGASTDGASGEVRPTIFGPPLDGSAGVMRLPVGSWLAWFGLPGPWQQAVGPMQFLPGTFEAWGVDADDDGVANPHDIDDAVASAANYLCGGDQGEITDERSALLRYNDDESYVARVLTFADEVGSAEGVALLCPVAGPTTFTNTWLAPRSGGRRHEGVDMFAAEGTPVVAPVGGEVELREGRVGGLAFQLWGDDGNYYYGAHLSGFTNVAGRVPAGTVVGYVGTTGNASHTDPHLHFEIHLGRKNGDAPKPIDPTDAVTSACPP